MLSNPTKLLILLLILGLVGCARVQKIAEKPSLQSAEPEAAPESSEPVETPVPKDFPSSGKTITLAFVGDIMMAGTSANKLKTQGPDSFFMNSAPHLKQADIAVGNLEGPLGIEGKVWVKKKYTFLVDPSAAGALARAGFDVLALANNHTMDYGPDALESTLKALKDAGLKHTGGGMNLAEAREPAWINTKGWKVAILSYSLTQPTEFWAGDEHPGCAPADGHLMREDIASAREKGADLVFINCHWGIERNTKLRSYQPTLSHLAIDAGADGVIGHHPHIWQALEVYKGKPIAYSLGNFAFGSLSSHTTKSGILYLSFNKENQWVGGMVLPMDVNNYRVNFNPTPMKAAAAKGFFDYLLKLSKKAKLSFEGTEIFWHAPTPPPETKNESDDSTENPNGSLPGTKR